MGRKKDKDKPQKRDYVWSRGKMAHYSILQDGTIQWHSGAKPEDLAKVKQGEVRDRPSH